MREPDRIERKDRSITAIWEVEKISDVETKLVTLSVLHSKHRKVFYAVLREETEEKRPGSFTSRSFMLFDGTTLIAEPVSRYSAKRLGEFYERAIERLAEAPPIAIEEGVTA